MTLPIERYKEKYQNWRFNPFTSDDYAVDKEEDNLAIPGSSPFIVQLLEVPRKNTPTSVSVRVYDVETEVDGDSASGQPVLNVASTAGFANTDKVIVNRGGAREEECVILSIQDGISLTMVDNLANTHTEVQADDVEKYIEFTEVAGAPAQSQFRVDYPPADGEGTGLLEFNNADNSKIIRANYKATGSPMLSEFLNTKVSHPAESPVDNQIIAFVSGAPVWRYNPRPYFHEGSVIYNVGGEAESCLLFRFKRRAEDQKVLLELKGAKLHQGFYSELSQHNHGVGTYAADAVAAHAHGKGTLASDAVGTHTHAKGTIATSSGGVAHTHGVGTLVVGNESAHTHGVGTLAAVVVGTHTHSISGNTGSKIASHTHAKGTLSGSQANHTHSVQGTSGDQDDGHTHSYVADGGGSHYTGEETITHGHYINLTSGSGGNQAVTISGNTASGGASHNHSISFTSGSGGGHGHSLSGTSAAGSAHNHGLSGATASHSIAHSHGVTGSTAAAGDHGHTISGSTASGGNHGHAISGSSANAGVAAKTYPHRFHVFINGVDKTTEVLALTALTQFGDGSSGHAFVTTGSGEMDISSLVAATQIHELKITEPFSGKGGRCLLHLELY